MKKIFIFLLLFLVLLTVVFPALETTALAAGETTQTLSASDRMLNTIIGACVGMCVPSVMFIVMGFVCAATVGWRKYVSAIGLSSLNIVLLSSALLIPAVVTLALIFR